MTYQRDTVDNEQHEELVRCEPQHDVTAELRVNSTLDDTLGRYSRFDDSLSVGLISQ